MQHVRHGAQVGQVVRRGSSSVSVVARQAGSSFIGGSGDRSSMSGMTRRQ